MQLVERSQPVRVNWVMSISSSSSIYYSSRLLRLERQDIPLRACGHRRGDGSFGQLGTSEARLSVGRSRGRQRKTVLFICIYAEVCYHAVKHPWAVGLNCTLLYPIILQCIHLLSLDGVECVAYVDQWPRRPLIIFYIPW